MVQEEVSPADEDAHLRADWRRFTALTFLFNLGFTIYMGVFQNFLREQLHSGPLQLGQLESMREVPGLLAALTTGTLVALAESRVAAIGLAITALGIGASGVAGHYWPLVALTVFWSLGFHLYSTMSPAITLTLARGKDGGRHLGRMTSVGAVATIGGLGLAWIVSEVWPQAPYVGYFAVAGACILVAAFMCNGLSTHASGTSRASIILRKEYGLYYLLIFLEGCRRQIFSICASFALIVVYKQPLSHMLLLQFLNSILIAFTAPAMGRLIDRIGERKPLTAYAIGLIVVFTGYATFHSIGALFSLYIVDNILFSFNNGFTTYLHRIVRKGELTPCLAMGVTMNHIAAVTVPLGGAILWQRSNNYQLPFWVGVGIAIVSLGATRFLPPGRAPSDDELYIAEVERL
jgi:MFS family permease